MFASLFATLAAGCVDYAGTYNLANFDLTIIQDGADGCSGQVVAGGRRQWTYTVDPVSGVIDGSRGGAGTGVFIMPGTISWSPSGLLWGPPPDVSAPGCSGLDAQPSFTTCRGGTPSRLGDWRTTPCSEQCAAVLNGREGCCMQSNKHNRKPHCYVTIGSKLDGVSVQPGSVASLQSISCNVPVYTGNEFVLGAPGATCPVGFAPITEQATCERANDELTAGLWGFGGNPMIGNWGNRPSGCFLQEKGYWKLNGSVMFNNHRAGVAQPGDRIICAASTGPAPTGSCAASNTRPASFCGYDTQFTNGERLTLLGDWRTESCVSKCNTYLNGREGCCLQTVNRIGCYAVAGGASDGVAVRPLTTGVIDSLQATHCA